VYTLFIKNEELKMAVKGIKLVWIVVKDLEKAIAFYTDIVGLTLSTVSKEYGWAELSGPEGTILGIVQENKDHNAKSGINAVITLTVDDIEASKRDFIKRGGKAIGDIQVVPGHVKLQDIVDPDGNMLQLAQEL
jgi:predicted enzyme related to lactoylglutathione lyase